MSAEVFVDTNVLIYAHDVDAGDKRARAAAILGELWATRRGALSTQVLQEFYVNVTRKIANPLDPAVARDITERYGAWPLIGADLELVLRAASLEQRAKLSYWEAMVIVAAQRAGTPILLTEDLSDGQRFEGVTVRNPFST